MLSEKPEWTTSDSEQGIADQVDVDERTLNNATTQGFTSPVEPSSSCQATSVKLHTNRSTLFKQTIYSA